jgi:hypothetical protein
VGRSWKPLPPRRDYSAGEGPRGQPLAASSPFPERAACRGSVGRARRDPEPQRARGVTAATDERDFAQDAARRRRRAIPAHLEVAAALDAGCGARLLFDQRGRRDVDWFVGRSARQLARELLGATDLLAELARAFALLAAGARWARHEVLSHVGARASTDRPSVYRGIFVRGFQVFEERRLRRARPSRETRAWRPGPPLA